MLIIGRIRENRSKARTLAHGEMLALLAAYSPQVLNGGPLGDQPAIIWVELLQNVDVTTLAQLIEHMGYVEMAWVLLPIAEAEWRRNRNDLLRWRKKPYKLHQLYKLDREAEREREPDRRIFAIPRSDGVHEVRGYRGSGTDSTRRALSVCDARLLINLSSAKADTTLLDPCAGGGSIVSEARRMGICSISIDNDPFVRFGLQRMASIHIVADACRIPLPSNVINAIASEPPFHHGTESLLKGIIAESHRVLRPHGVIALLIAEHQIGVVRDSFGEVGIQIGLCETLDRHGTACAVLCGQKIESYQS